MSEKGATVKPVIMGTGHADDFQTDPSALDCLVPYLPAAGAIWEPACGSGFLGRGLRARGFEVLESDIKAGRDFLSWRPDAPFSCIVTNPPYSCKEAFLKRAVELRRPFAFLMRESVFDSKERRRILRDQDVTLILPPGRVKFTTPNGTYGGAWFYTFWLCVGFGIGRGIVFPDE